MIGLNSALFLNVHAHPFFKRIEVGSMSNAAITLPMCSVDFMDTTLSWKNRRLPTAFKS